MKRKILIVFLAIVAALCLAFVVAACGDNSNGGKTDNGNKEPEVITGIDGLEYTLLPDGKSYALTGLGTAQGPEITIASYVNGKPVTQIGLYNFKSEEDVPKEFYEMSENEYNELMLGLAIFKGENYKNNVDSTFEPTTTVSKVNIPDTVTAIGDYAFAYSDIESIEIPDNVTTINYNAFYYSIALAHITIPDSVTFIGGAAFYNTGYYNDETNWDNDVLYIGKHLIEAKYSLTGNYAIKDGTLTIGSFAFSFSKLTSLTIPDSVTSIGSSAFYNCWNLTSISVDGNNNYYKSVDGNLYDKNGTTLIQYTIVKTDTSFTVPDSVTSIGAGAFMNSGITNITIPDSVTTIGDYAFEDSGLTNITIPNSVTFIGWGAFYGCWNLTNISVDRNNNYYKSIDGNLYDKNGTTLIQYAIGKTDTSFTIPDSVSSIGIYAFAYSNLTSINIPDSVIKFGKGSFFYCRGLTNVTIGNGVTSIGGSVFQGCRELKSIVIPDSVSSIGWGAFYGCSGLESVTIGSGVTYIEDMAFEDCSGLTDIYFNGTKAQWSAIGYWGSYSGEYTIHCTDGDIVKN